MRVFVLGTGRCGTSTFYHACKHITNFTCGHESSAGRCRLPNYPDQHIEIAGHLWMFAGQIYQRWPDSRWVHLIRSRAECVESIAQVPTIPAFGRHWAQSDSLTNLQAASMFYDCVNANIRMMLKSVPSITMPLGWFSKDWDRFWEFIDAEGDFNASLAEGHRHYNSRGNRGRDNLPRSS